MSNPRVYGSVIHDGLRHEASGVIDGTFARQKGGWDTNTTCGKYIGTAVDTDLDLVVTCLRCIGKRRPDGILRGKHADITIIDEAQDFDPAVLEKLAASLPHGADVQEIIGVEEEGVLTRISALIVT